MISIIMYNQTFSYKSLLTFHLRSIFLLLPINIFIVRNLNKSYLKSSPNFSYTFMSCCHLALMIIGFSPILKLNIYFFVTITIIYDMCQIKYLAIIYGYDFELITLIHRLTISLHH